MTSSVNGLRWEQDPDLHAAIFDEGDATPDLLGLPGAVARAPLGALEGDPAARAWVAEILRRARVALQTVLAGGRAAPIDLRVLDPTSRRLLDETLRQGEVSALIAGPESYQISETALTGLWQVRADRPNDTPIVDHLEAGDVPLVLHAAAEALTAAEFVPVTPLDEPGNALPVLTEIRHWMQVWRPGMPNHVISLTLLPMTDQDLSILGRTIGGGAVKAWSSGYGTVRTTLTRARGVWQVEYLNAQDKVVVDTIEIGGIPTAITAAREDFEDSIERLSAILEACSE